MISKTPDIEVPLTVPVPVKLDHKLSPRTTRIIMNLLQPGKDITFVNHEKTRKAGYYEKYPHVWNVSECYISSEMQAFFNTILKKFGYMLDINCLDRQSLLVFGNVPEHSDSKLRIKGSTLFIALVIPNEIATFFHEDTPAGVSLMSGEMILFDQNKKHSLRVDSHPSDPNSGYGLTFFLKRIPS